MGTREVWIFLCPSWPQQCSPLSTVFDLIKVSDEEHQALGGGPIVTVDRYELEIGKHTVWTVNEDFRKKSIHFSKEFIELVRFG